MRTAPDAFVPAVAARQPLARVSRLIMRHTNAAELLEGERAKTESVKAWIS